MMGRYGALGLFRRPEKKDRLIAIEALTHVGMESHKTRRWVTFQAGNSSESSLREP